MTANDYLETRVFHLLLTIYYYEDNFGEAFRLAREFGQPLGKDSHV